MKKIMKLFVLVAAAAMALASCQKNEINGPVNKEVHFIIKADFAETKTAITDNGDKTYTPTWANGDKIGVLFALEENAKVVDFENTADAGVEATFEGKHAFTVEGATEVDGNLYAFYPRSAFDKVYSDGGVRLDLNATQYPTSTSFDPSCDLLIAKPCYYKAEATGENAEVLIEDMYFARMMSVLRINLNSEFLSNETVKSISFDADGVDFTGAMKFNLETGEFVGNQSTAQDLSEVKASYSAEDPIYVAGEKNSAYLVLAPVTIPSGTTLTFAIETENYDIVKTITAPADMVMPAGNIAVINLTIAEENCTAKTEDTSDYSGKWLITGVKDEQVYAASAYVSGNNLKSVAISIENDQILEVDGIANCMMTLTKVADGDYAGMYTITDVNDKYLYAASSSGNQLKGATEVSVNAYWTVKLQENGTYSIVASKSFNRNIMQFNGSDADNILFNCYSSASQSPVTLYPYSMVKADTTPRITVEDTEYNVSADDETLEFSYTTKNIDGTPTVSVADGATMTTVKAEIEEGIVNVTFGANAEEVEKTATLVLSYEGAESVSVTITQAAKVAEGGESEWISTPFANLKEGDQVVIVSTKNTDTWAMSNDKGTGSAPAGVTGVTYSNDKLKVEPAENIIWYVGVNGNNRIFYKDSNKDAWLYCTATNNGVRVGTNQANTFTLDAESGYLKHVGTQRYIGVYTTNPDWRCYTSTTTNIGDQIFKFFVKTDDGGETPEEPSTPVLEVNPTIVNIAAAGGNAEFGYTVTNPTDGVTVSASTEATWISGFSYSTANKVSFTVVENTATEAREAVVTLAYKGAASKTITVKQAAKTPTYSSLAELVAAGQPTTAGTKVNVTLTDEEITGIFVTSKGYRNGVFLQVGEQEIEIYCRDVPEEWVVGGTLSGTLSECDWKLYNTTWELCPSGWTELEYTAPEGGVVEPETPTYSSLAELVAAGQPTTAGTKVNVTLTDEEITGIFVTSKGYRNGVFLQVGEQEIEIYCRDVPEEWVVGGTLSGTLSECDWKLYNTTWELCPSGWTELEYTAPEEPEVPGTGGYTVIKTISDLTAGTYLVGGNNADKYADGTMYMWSSAETVSGQKLKTAEATYSSGSFTTDVSNFVRIELISTGKANEYYIKVGEKYLHGAQNVFSLVSNPVAWTFADMGGSKEGIYFYNTTNSSYVFINSKTDAIRTYGKDTKYKGIYFFRAN